MTKGIMFHHFHGNGHIKTQGSIDQKKFIQIIKKIKKKYNLLNANNFYEKCISKKLKKNDVCLTFDDGLKCQYDIAYPILKKMKIKAFFFLYSSAINKPSNLEIIRDFRFRCFNDINDFYTEFFNLFENLYYRIDFKSHTYKNYLKNYRFYSLNDRIYRYLRDKILDEKEYLKIIFKMMRKKKYNKFNYSKKLIMSKSNIKKIINNGNLIGLHSHSHIVDLTEKNYNYQLKEYKLNLNFLYKNFKIRCNAVSYPFGRYNRDTLKIMTKIGVKVGFLSTENFKKKKTKLEISRMDHNTFL